MADIRIVKQGVETVADSPTYAGQTRVSVEVAGANSANSSPLKVTKFAAEVIADSPLSAAFTRVNVEVAGANSANTAPVKITKLGVEVLSSKLKVLDATRVAVEVMGSKSDTTSPIQVAKLGVEFIARASPSLPSILPEPDYWKVFCHNWAKSVKISSGYLTDITRSPYDLTEERRCMLNRPFRTITYNWTALKRDSLDAMLSYIKRMTNQRTFMPLYCDQVQASETFEALAGVTYTFPCAPGARRFFVNQRVALVELDEDLIPLSVDLHVLAGKGTDFLTTTDAIAANTYPKGRTVMLPCIDTELVMAPKVDLTSPTTGNLELTVFEVTGATALPPVWTGIIDPALVFEDDPIFNFEPNWSAGSPKMSFKREGEISNQGKGRIARVEGDRYRVLHSYPLSFERSDFFEFLKFFDSRRGRVRRFWHVDLDYTWQLAGQGGVGNIYLDIQPINDFADFSYNVNDDFTHVGIVLQDGTVYVREVTAFDDTGSVFRVTTSGLPDIAADDIVRIARARKTRWLKDALDEDWITTEWVNATFECIELLNDAEVILE